VVEQFNGAIHQIVGMLQNLVCRNRNLRATRELLLPKLIWEGYGDRWAGPPPANRFAPGADPWETLQEVMRFCNISQPPTFQRGLCA